MSYSEAKGLARRRAAELLGGLRGQLSGLWEGTGEPHLNDL